ncbi:MAG: S1C family serine protease [Actinomycetota bacterium]
MNRRLLAGMIAAVLVPACSVKLDRPIGAEAEPFPSVSLHRSEAPPVHSDTADVVARVLPSVVNVRVTALTTGPFGETTQGKGEGSGVVIDGSNGIILTNNHVIRDALEVTVVTSDGRSMEGSVTGTSPENDLAVIQVDADDLTTIEIGRSRDLRLGDDVLAIGFPLGLGSSATVTKGIISATQRTIRPDGETGLQGLLQTDAAINPGNSGGALVDAAGRLVGINTAAAQASAAENIGFAIAIDRAIPVLEEIMSEPIEKRAWLGVSVATLDPTTAAQLGIDPATEGVVITDLLPGPARGAGLVPGDVIVRVGGSDVARAEDLTSALAGLEPGEVTELVVVSADGSRTVEVELARRPERLTEP